MILCACLSGFAEWQECSAHRVGGKWGVLGAVADHLLYVAAGEVSVEV